MPHSQLRPSVGEKHGLILEDETGSPVKRPRLTILAPQQQLQQQQASQQIPVKSLLNNTGGIVTVSKGPVQTSVMHHGGGLLQIAKPVLHQSGGSTTTISTSASTLLAVGVGNKVETKNMIPTSFSIPGIPIPSMAGVLTGIKPPPSQALFSLPGKRASVSTDLNMAPPEKASRDQNLQENKAVPHIPGMPGPSKDQASTIQVPTKGPDKDELKREIKVEVTSGKEDSKFLRPNSLPLTPGTFKTKKHVMLTAGDTLVSPETPRPRKSSMLQYQNGTAYSTLGFKSSTKVYYTTIFHQQPMYVANKPRISMYSNWRVVTKVSLINEI